MVGAEYKYVIIGVFSVFQQALLFFEQLGRSGRAFPA